MDAILNLKTGDYRVWLRGDELLVLQNGLSVEGLLNYIKGDATEIHQIKISLKPRDEIRKLKTELRQKELYFYEGPHVMIEVQNKVHTVSYIKEEIDDLSLKISLDNPFGYQENRYDGPTGRKIFLYPQTEQG